MNLQDFLLSNEVTGLTKEVYPGDRFVAAKLPFTIRAMTNAEFDEYSKRATVTVTKKGKVTRDFSSSVFSNLSVINCTIIPNFKDAEMLKKSGCATPDDFMTSRLLPGEVAQLAQEISALSGFDQTVDELADEVKNG